MSDGRRDARDTADARERAEVLDDEARARRRRSRAAAASAASLVASFSASRIAKSSSDCLAFSEQIL